MKTLFLKLKNIQLITLLVFGILLIICKPSFSQDEDDFGPAPSGSTVPVAQSMSFTGAATQSIPIVVPPGRNGIGPNLSLNYNSYQKNGWVGVGWSLEMGAIQRSTKRGVDYDADDYVATINGSTSELVKIDDNGNFRAKIEGAFTEYVFENNTWTVTTKDGTVYTYGDDKDTRQYDPSDNSRIFKWCLSRVEDPNGNYMAVSYNNQYTASYGDREIYPSEIKYTGNTNGANPKNRVEFLLENRSDNPDRYASKFRIATTQRLYTINVYAPDENGNEELVRSYELEYDSSPTTTRSRLWKVHQYGKNGGVLPETVFQYQSGARIFDDEAFQNYDVQAYHDNPEDVYVADLNGDKTADILLGPDASGNFDVYINGGDDEGWYVWATGVIDYDDNPYEVQVTDITGDGMADVVYGPDADGYFYYCKSTGEGFSAAVCLNPDDAFWDSGYGGLHPMDVNGDGKMDIVAGPLYKCDDESYNLVVIKYWVFLTVESSGNFIFEMYGRTSMTSQENDPPLNDNYRSQQIRPMDINNDGYSDILFGPTASGLFDAWISDGNNTFIPSRSYVATLNNYQSFFDDFGGNWGEFKTADVNGDGLQDVVYLYTDGKIGVLLNTGEGFRNDGYWYQNSSWNLFDRPYRVHMMDANGDGMADAVIHIGDDFYVLRSTGSDELGFVLQVSQNNTSSWGGHDWASLFDLNDYVKKYQQRTAENNADGFTDIMLGPDDYGHFILLNNGGASPEMPDLLEKVENGYGAYTEIEYTPSTQYAGTDHTTMPFPVHTASKITINDGLGASYATNYTYVNPAFSYENRDFFGFATATRKNPDNSKVLTTFHQDEYRKGRVISEKLYDENGSYFGYTQYTWDATEEVETDSYFVKMKKKVTKFPNDGVTTTETYVYNSENGGIGSKTVSGNNAGAAKTENDWVDLGTSAPMWRLLEERLLDSTGAWYRKTWYDYDSDGKLVEKRYYLDDSTYESETFTYDSYGNPTGGLTPRGTSKPTVVYDSITHTFPYTTTNALGHTVTTIYDYGFGKIDKQQDVNGHWTDNDYDQFGRLVSTCTIDSDTNETVARVDTDYIDDESPRHVVTSVTEEAGSTIDSYTFYDGLGRARVTATEGESGQVIASSKFYDEMSRNFRSAGPYFTDSSVTFPLDEDDYDSTLLFPPSGDYTHPWVENEYDSRGRTVKVKSPDQSGGSGRINTVTYAYNGMATTVTDPDGASKTEVSDYLGRVIKVIEHADTGDQVTTYEYNIAGDLEYVTDALGNITHNTYDRLGRKETMSDPDMGSWSYTYDPNGNLDTQTDANGQVIEFTYDVLDRVKVKHYVETTDTEKDVLYHYDNVSISNGKGRLYSVSKKDSEPEIPVGETVYGGYDALGQVLEVTRSIQNASGTLDSYTTEYEYDMAGKTTLISYPDNTDVEYTYHPGTGLLNEVLFPDAGGTHVVHAEFTDYEPSGKIGSINYAQNGVYTLYYYDESSGRLSGIETKDGDQDIIQKKSYTYSGAGDIVSITDTNLGVTHTYTYDSLHRLTGETSNAAVNEFDGKQIIPVYPEQQWQAGQQEFYPVHAPKLVYAPGGPYDYSYDYNGNMTLGWDFSDPADPKQRDFEYNADNMPVEIVHESEGTTEYCYDGGGQRVKKVAPDGTTYYVGDHYEVKDNGTTIKYVFAGNIRLAMVDSSGIYYYHKDHLGSTAAMTMATDSAIQTNSGADYLPFGGERTLDTHTLSNYAFTDQERDPESGLYNYNARLYDPVIGQFITPDSIVQNPFDPQMLNRYSYCRNNPLTYVDPSGHFLSIFLAAVVTHAVTDSVAHAVIAATVEAFLSYTDPGRDLVNSVSEEVFQDVLGLSEEVAGAFSHMTLSAGLTWGAGAVYDHVAGTPKLRVHEIDLHEDQIARKNQIDAEMGIFKDNEGVGSFKNGGSPVSVTAQNPDGRLFRLTDVKTGEVMGYYAEAPAFKTPNWLGIKHTSAVMKSVRTPFANSMTGFSNNGFVNFYAAQSVCHQMTNQVFRKAGYALTVQAIGFNWTKMFTASTFGPYVSTSLMYTKPSDKINENIAD